MKDTQTDEAGATGVPEDVELRLDLRSPDAVASWSAIDDVVMGGVSSSALRPSGDGSALFAGEVSLENNGGFASVRSSPRDWDLSGRRGLALRVRGDGKSYKLNARTDEAFDGVSWQAAFPTRGGEWTTVRIAFDELEPRWRGRLVGDAGPLRPESIRTLGLMISDGQAGPFRLELAWIGAWR